MSEQARSEMDRVNSARFTTPMPAQAPDATDPLQPAAPDAHASDRCTAPAKSPTSRDARGPSVNYDAGLVRIQVLLDRAHFSPGVIDGYDGENVRKAVSAYQHANDLPVNGLADDALLTRLEQADASPALVAYVLTAEDVAGPFVDVPQRSRSDVASGARRLRKRR